MLRPSDCEFPDLRSPGGERLDLTGRWIGATVGAPLVVPGPTDWTGEWIRQHGDCLWAVLFSPAVEDPTLEPDAWVWYGRIGSAFVIDLVEVGVTDRETDPTSLDRAVRQWRIGFDREDEPFLCDSANPRCPSDLAPGDPYEVRLSDSDR